MAFNVAFDVSAEAPWNGRSTPTISVLPALLPPPPVPDLLHAAVPATRVTAATASAVMRLVMLVLSVIDGVPNVPDDSLLPDLLADAQCRVSHRRPPLCRRPPPYGRRPTALDGECLTTTTRGEACLTPRLRC